MNFRLTNRWSRPPRFWLEVMVQSVVERHLADSGRLLNSMLERDSGSSRATGDTAMAMRSFTEAKQRKAGLWAALCPEVGMTSQDDSIDDALVMTVEVQDVAHG